MTISVRPVDHASDREELLGILQTNLLAIPHARRFQWLYCANPDGPAYTWFAYEKGTDHVVGVASVFPRAAWVGPELKICGQVGDFAVPASHRSLGPALLLQRATFEPVNQGKLALCYDCPPPGAAMATFRRLGFESNCTMERYALPLRVDNHLSKHLGFAVSPLASAGNVVLRMYRRAGSRRRDFEIIEHKEPFGDEFSLLDKQVGSTCAIRVQRSTAQLNWRYRENPLQGYCVLTARRKGELVAFIVFSVTDGTVRIEDLFGQDVSEAGVALLEAVVARCELSHQTIEAFLSKESPLINPFLKAHFRRRSVTAQVVAYTKQGSDTSTFLQQAPKWLFTGADIRA